MIYLNLLPYKFRKELRLRYLYRSLFRIGFILIFFVLVISGIFYVSNKIFLNFYEVISDTNFIMSKDVKEPIKTKEVNLKIDRISGLTDKSLSWTSIISSTTRPFKEGICLNSLEIDKKSQKAHIRGIADNRDVLIDLKNSLGKF